MLLDALMRMDSEQLRALAAAAVGAVRRAWSPAGPSAARTTCTARCGSSTPRGSSAKMMAQAEQDQLIGEGAFDERLAREEFEGRLKVLKEMIEAEIRRRLVADRGVEAMARTLRKPLPEDVDFMHASREEMQQLQKAIYPLTRALAARLAQRRKNIAPRHARLPPDRAALALVRRGARGAEVQAAAPVEAGDHGGRRHLGFGRVVRPLHAAVRVRDAERVLEGPVVGVHRRHRRGHALLRRGRRRRRRDPAGEHRSRRRVGRRPLRLRARVRGVARAPHPRGHAQVVDHPARRRPQQLPRVAGVDAGRDAQAGRGACSGSIPSRAATGTPATRSCRSTRPTATASSRCRNLRQLQKFVEDVVGV